MMRRPAAILFCVPLLALVWLRSPVAPVNHEGRITLRPLAVAQLPSPGPGMVLERAWQLDSTDEHFGGYSALLALAGGSSLSVTVGANWPSKSRPVARSMRGWAGSPRMTASTSGCSMPRR